MSEKSYISRENNKYWAQLIQKLSNSNYGKNSQLSIDRSQLTIVNFFHNENCCLPPDERIVLAQRVWDSVEQFVDPEIEQAWLNEAERRWQEIEQGRVQCIPAKEVMKKARNALIKKK